MQIKILREYFHRKFTDGNIPLIYSEKQNN